MQNTLHCLFFLSVTYIHQVNPLFPADAYLVSFAPSCLAFFSLLPKLVTLALSRFKQDASLLHSRSQTN